MRIAICYSAQRDTPDTDLTEVVAELVAAIAAVGHAAIAVALTMDLKQFWLDWHAAQPDLVWNLCEEACGMPERELHAAGLLELLGKPVVGSSPVTVALCSDKSLCRLILHGWGVRVPFAVRIDDPSDVPPMLPLPAIVKPAQQDGSVGVDSNSVCRTRQQVLAAVERLHKVDLLPALVEQYIEGREINILLMGKAGMPPQKLAFGEIELSGVTKGRPKILTYAGKWDPASPEFQQTPSHYPATLDLDLQAQLHQMAGLAARALGLSGYARLDVRVDERGDAWAIDVNPSPDLSPGAGVQRALPTIGLTFAEFVALQVQWATLD